MAMERVATAMYLAGDLVPASKPKVIPGMEGPVGEVISYALWLLILAGVGGVIFGLIKLATSDKSRNSGGSEPFKWIGGGLVAVILSSSVIAIVNGVAG
ncbi:hypothetical protein [Streptomyces sp. NPDC001068]|uniref:hypothetical protein n=1 Tax=Streptomyces sp. NPDC001068 TaxID=3364544 RepID=UPI0036756F65